MLRNKIASAFRLFIAREHRSHRPKTGLSEASDEDLANQGDDAGGLGQGFGGTVNANSACDRSGPSFRSAASRSVESVEVVVEILGLSAVREAISQTAKGSGRRRILLQT